jgi:hypothetical protein
MARTRITLVLLLGALLLLDAEPGDPSAMGTAGDSERVLTEADVLATVGELNPTLTPRQLRRIAASVMRNSEKYDLDPALVVAVIQQESTARPWVRSPKGAVGLMQVMPYMMAPLEIAGNSMTIESNIEAGCLILADNIRRLGEERGILAYFWGNQIRGVSYLERVQEARAALRRVES